MGFLKSVINYFDLEGGTRPRIVNIARPRVLINYFLFFLFRKFNLINLPYKPVNLMVEVSTRCNLGCPTCERELYKSELGGLPKENVSLENIMKLSPLLPYVYSIYLVAGLGEPFLNPEFWKIHDFLKSFGIKTGYFTNASLLTREIIEKTFQEKVNTVTISIDTFDKEKYSQIKKGAMVDKAIEMITMFGSLKKELKAKYFSLGLNFIFRKDNYNDIIEYLELAKELGVDYVHCTTLITHLEKDKNLSFLLLSQEVQQDILEKASKKAKQLGIGIRLPNLVIGKNHTCGLVWRCLSIFYNGDVCACPFFRTDRQFYFQVRNGRLVEEKKWMKNTVVGNYLKNNIMDIWNGERIKQIRKDIISLSRDTTCGTCYYKYNVH